MTTARVGLGSHVTIGPGTLIEIGVDIGDGSHMGALSFVPTHARVPSGATCAGIPRNA